MNEWQLLLVLDYMFCVFKHGIIPSPSKMSDLNVHRINEEWMKALTLAAFVTPYSLLGWDHFVKYASTVIDIVDYPSPSTENSDQQFLFLFISKSS